MDSEGDGKGAGEVGDSRERCTLSVMESGRDGKKERGEMGKGLRRDGKGGGEVGDSRERCTPSVAYDGG